MPHDGKAPVTCNHRRKELLYLFVRTSIANNSFYYQGGVVWNSLDQSLYSSTTLSLDIYSGVARPLVLAGHLLYATPLDIYRYNYISIAVLIFFD